MLGLVERDPHTLDIRVALEFPDGDGRVVLELDELDEIGAEFLDRRSMAFFIVLSDMVGWWEVCCGGCFRRGCGCGCDCGCDCDLLLIRNEFWYCLILGGSCLELSFSIALIYFRG